MVLTNAERCAKYRTDSPLTGALAIHEILIGSDLSIKKKHLPTDPFYKSVQIKESRKKSSVVTPLLDDDEEME